MNSDREQALQEALEVLLSNNESLVGERQARAALSQSPAVEQAEPVAHLMLAHAAHGFGMIYECLEKKHYDEAMLHAGGMQVRMQKAAALGNEAARQALTDRQFEAIIQEVRRDMADGVGTTASELREFLAAQPAVDAPREER